MVIPIDKALDGLARATVDANLYSAVADSFMWRIPEGVHVLTEESQTILERARLRGQQIERRHIKRGS